MDEISCPRCKTTNYRNPQLQLMVNSCGHGLCLNCVNLLFAKGSGNCPSCNVPLRRINFRYQYFQDATVEKEVEIRKKIMKDFCKKEDDFPTLRAYNDYLEEVEEIIQNLTHEINVEATKRKIEQYKKENSEIINKSRGKKSKDEEELEDLIEEEKELESLRRNRSLLSETEELNRAKAKQKEALVDELMFTDRPAEEIVAMHSNIAGKELASRQSKQEEEERIQVNKAKNRFSTGVEFGRGSSIFLPLPKEPEGQLSELLKLDEEPIDPKGPKCPAFDELGPEGYTLHVKSADKAEVAGGFSSLLPCHRALQEGFNSLYYTSASASASSF